MAANWEGGAVSGTRSERAPRRSAARSTRWAGGKAAMEALEAKGHSQESSQDPGPPGGSVPPAAAAAAAGGPRWGRQGAGGKMLPLISPSFPSGRAAFNALSGFPLPRVPFLKDPPPTPVCPREAFLSWAVFSGAASALATWAAFLSTLLHFWKARQKQPGQPQMLQAVRTILLSQVNGGKPAFPHLGTNLVPVALAGL